MPCHGGKGGKSGRRFSRKARKAWHAEKAARTAAREKKARQRAHIREWYAKVFNEKVPF